MTGRSDHHNHGWDNDRHAWASSSDGRHVRGRPLTGIEEAAALAELAEVADGRVDLLAEQAGLAIGFHDQDADAPLTQRPSHVGSRRDRGARPLRGGNRSPGRCDQRTGICGALRPERSALANKIAA